MNRKTTIEKNSSKSSMSIADLARKLNENQKETDVRTLTQEV